jgi:hypothetical protein
VGYGRLIQEIEAACKRRRSRRMERVQDVLVALRENTPILDVIAQQEPIAAFVWGSIRLVIKVRALSLHPRMGAQASIIYCIPRTKSLEWGGRVRSAELALVAPEL